MITLAVYGTLKRGNWNHEHYCAGVTSVEEAVVRGRLYLLASDIPILQVPDEDILAVGTCDPLADVATQARFTEELAWTPTGNDRGWDWVRCELMTFSDAERRLPRIDCLEGFRPGGVNLYRRVLLPVVRDSGATPAWCYVSDGASLQGARLSGKVNWP